MALGVLLGCEVKVNVDALLEKWKQSVNFEDNCINHVFVEETKTSLLGVWVIVSSKMKPFFARIEAEVPKARDTWEKFAAFCLEHEKLSLAASQLWLLLVP